MSEIWATRAARPAEAAAPIRASLADTRLRDRGSTSPPDSPILSGNQVATVTPNAAALIRFDLF